ncbi:glycoside hydrolase [Aspergillus sclerotiicarbonarius CBS 121057]|uniref:Glycoside hydrolase n=1 Tax=Aspergillus sclerotiicarbonarius (strain CBS 121057 / IBT 28362) TaxID=1448318 RepID=A0A319FNU3_ASPSB|nr:glycoside hydrolase [Aspergillus sclerotiicarbonarius CBS 121057]
MFINYLIPWLLVAPPVIARTGPQVVFAHFIVGNAAAMTPEQWESDIRDAREAHIDGFALNIAPQDSYTDDVLDKAYSAAESVGNFSLFLSFDYGSGGPWPADRVISTINAYRNRSAQYNYHGKPLVSTFVGSGNADDWPYIKQFADCFFMPSWSDLGPAGTRAYLDTIDGAFSWDAWPVGAQNKNVTSDREWMHALSGKPYMMPVSPWFYVNLPQWNKNWLWRGDDLWHTRWEQVMNLQPAFVQIISWNDYGEAHYIGPIYDAGMPDGSSSYVSDHPHDAWRALLPHYIAAYRGQNPTDQYQPTHNLPVADKIVYWYRLNPSHAGSANGTTGNNPAMGQEEMMPGQVAQDRIFVSAAVEDASEIFVQIGYSPPTVLQASGPGINHFSVPFNGQTGPVRIVMMRNYREVAAAVGPAITDECKDGNVNWNAYVGSSD